MPTKASAAVMFDGDPTKLLRAYEKILAKAEELDKSHRKVKRSGEEAGKQMETSFGARAMTSLVNYAAGFTTLATGIGIAKQALTLMADEARMAIANVEQLTEARRKLIQVSEGAADIEQMNVTADYWAAQYGVNRDEARRLIFSARSEKFAGHEAGLLRLARANVANLQSSIESAGTLRGVFDYKITPMQAVVGNIVGAKTSKLSVEEFVTHMQRLGTMAQAIGSPPTEAIATMGLLATKSPRAAEYTGTFLGELMKHKQFRGLGIEGAIEALNKMPERQREKLMGGSKEALQAHLWLSAYAKDIPKGAAAIESEIADPEAFIAKMERAALDPRTFEGRLRRAQVEQYRAANLRDIAREREMAIGSLGRETAANRVLAATTAAGTQGVQFYTMWSFMKALQYSGMPPAFIEQAGLAGNMMLGGRAAGMQLSESATRGLQDAADKLNQAGEAMLQSQDRSRAQRGAVAGVAE